MPDLNGNIPSHVFYGSVMSESAVSLYKRMINQGGSEASILRQISKAINRHHEPFSKFSKSAKDIMNDITVG